MSDTISLEERQRFLSNWLDYVAELGGPSSPRQALRDYRSERSWLLERIRDGLPIHRMVTLPADIDVDAMVGTAPNIGRFWTSDSTVARNWRPGGEYGGVPEPGDGIQVVVSAAITDVSQIDIVETVACRLGSSWEQEIRMAPGFLPVITAVQILAKPAPAAAF